MSQFLFKKEVEAFTIISRFGEMAGEQFEIRLRADDDWLAFLNFGQRDAVGNVNGRNSQGIPELFAPAEQFVGVVNLLRREQVVWFTLYEEPLAGWLATGTELVGIDYVNHKLHTDEIVNF